MWQKNRHNSVKVTKEFQIMYTSSIARWRENYDFNDLE